MYVHMTDKKKLTLSINSTVIEKAKDLGLNLSEITEKALKISSLNLDDSKLVTPDKLCIVYGEVLKEIAKVLKKWDLHLKIGSYNDCYGSTDSNGNEHEYGINYDYFISPDQVYLWSDMCDYEPHDTWKFDDENLPITRFYDPEKIISSLIDELYNKANDNSKFVQKLQILKNILELSEISK